MLLNSILILLFLQLCLGCPEIFVTTHHNDHSKITTLSSGGFVIIYYDNPTLTLKFQIYSDNGAAICGTEAP